MTERPAPKTMRRPAWTHEEIEDLVQAAVNLSDKLNIRDDHVEFTGSMNQAEDFREIAQAAWHKLCGWR